MLSRPSFISMEQELKLSKTLMLKICGCSYKRHPLPVQPSQVETVSLSSGYRQGHAMQCFEPEYPKYAYEILCMQQHVAFGACGWLLVQGWSGTVLLVPSYMRVALQLRDATALVYEIEYYTTTMVINSAEIAPQCHTQARSH